MASKRNSAQQKSGTDAASELPGYFIRRLQQEAVAKFMLHTQEQGITPVQFAALRAVKDQSGIDQRTLAECISFDTSTIGGVIDRLEARGLMTRSASPDDKRVRLLALTVEGDKLLRQVMPAVLRTQQDILAPLSAAEQKQFMKLVRKLVDESSTPSIDDA